MTMVVILDRMGSRYWILGGLMMFFFDCVDVRRLYGKRKKETDTNSACSIEPDYYAKDSFLVEYHGKNEKINNNTT